MNFRSLPGFAVAGLLLASDPAHADLVLRLAAPDYDPDTGVWADSSGNGNDATQGTAGSRPTLAGGLTPNGSATSFFDGGDWLSLTSNLVMPAGQGFTVFAYLRPENNGTIVGGTATNAFQYRVDSTGRHRILKQSVGTFLASPDTAAGKVPQGATAAFSSLVAQGGAGTRQLRADGVTVAGPGTGNFAFSAINRIGLKGTGATERFRGSIAEIRVYNEILSLAAIEAVEAQLRNAYIVVEPESFALSITPNAGNPGNYDFEWESRQGKVYDLVSETVIGSPSEGWALWDNRSDMAASGTGTNSLVDIPGGGDPARFFAVIESKAPPVEVFSESFDGTTPGSLPADWSSGRNDPPDGTSLTNWEPGTPANVGPVPPVVPLPSGTNCVATNISGNYDDPITDLGVGHSDVWLRTPAIDVSGATAGTLTFQQWTQIEDVPGDLDYGSIRILDAGDDSELAVMEDRSIDGSTAGWEEYSMALPAEAFTAVAGTIKLEFRFEADDIDSLAGWYIDDVSVTVGTP